MHAHETVAADPQTSRSIERHAILVAGGAHALHDGYTDTIFVMLPLWQAEFALSYAAVGLLRGLYAGTMAALQVPASLLSERVGVAVVLAVGTALAGVGYVLAGSSIGLLMLAAALLVGGIGSSTQHPLASAMVAQAFAGPRSLKAIGTYNFAGDIGKMTLPFVAALMLVLLPWQTTVACLGAVGVAAAGAIWRLAPRLSPVAAPAAAAVAGETGPVPHRYGFPLLVGIGLIDGGTRMAFLTYLPFLLAGKGATVATTGLALTLVFAGGAAGKLACAFLGARIGVFATVLVTEAMTAATILLLLPLPLGAALALLPLIGIALNGTSSVLYGSVATLVRPDRRARAFGLFYTAGIGSGAAAPVLFGAVSDALGLIPTLTLIAGFVLLTLPLAVALRPALPRFGE